LWLLPLFTSYFLICVYASSSAAFVQPNCGCPDFHSSDFVSIPGAAQEAAQAYSLAARLAVGVDDRVKRWRLKFLENYSTTEDTGQS
jgi:hypothetical protein